MHELKHPLLLLLLLATNGCWWMSQGENDGFWQNDAIGTPTAQSDKTFSLLDTSFRPLRLQVFRGMSAPLLQTHLPIAKHIVKGRRVCRVEVEELAPTFSVVGHFEPKKFDCNFNDGDVRYLHEGNPILNSDTVRVTVFFFRNNYSIIQTSDIHVDVLDHPAPLYTKLDLNSTEYKEEKKAREQILQHANYQASRLSGSLELNVESVKGISDSLGPSVMKISYDPLTEDCRLAYTRHDILTDNSVPDEKAIEEVTGRPYQTPWWESNAGLWSPRLGQPLASGHAIGGSRRWPLFGQLVAFNKSVVQHFEHDCQEGLLKGYRYLHRKSESPGADYIPIQVTIWKRSAEGSHQVELRESKYLKVTIGGARDLIQPTIRIFRQVNLTHIGGSFSVLPKDCVMVPADAVPGEEFLDLNVTRVQGPLYAQLVNLRDPTRPIMSFRIAELRKGLIALQMLNYAELIEKTFTLTLVVIDPFMQVSEPVNLKLVSYLQPVFREMTPVQMTNKKPFVFQVFTLPLFSFTGATSIVQKYNIQVVGYIDESMIRFQVMSNKEEQEYFKLMNRSTPFSEGNLLLYGQPITGLKPSWSLNEIATQQVLYSHPGGLQPCVDRFRLQLNMVTPDSQNGGYGSSMAGFRYSSFLRRHRRYASHSGWKDDQQRMQRRRRHRRTIRNKQVARSEIELPVRTVRVYENAKETALKPDSIITLLHGEFRCLTSDMVITLDALMAARSDFVDLHFLVKIQPTQGSLVRRSSLLQPPGQKRPARRLLETAKENEAIGEELGLVRLSDLENGDICYLNQRKDSRQDMIGLKQMGRIDFPTVAIGIEISPKPKYQLTRRVNPKEVMEVSENVNFAAIPLAMMRYVLRPTRQWMKSSASNITPLMPNSSEITYTLTQHPIFVGVIMDESGMLTTHDAGRLVSLTAVSASDHEGDTALRPGLATYLRNLEPQEISSFTQTQIDAGDIVFVPPKKDIGPKDKTVEIRFTVSAPGISAFSEQNITIKVLAEDDQTPRLEQVKPISVHRDGDVIVTEELLRLSDEDTFFEKLSLTLEKAPAHGDLFEVTSNDALKGATNGNSKRRIEEKETFSALLLKMGILSYIQDGSNVKEDSFNLSATDGRQASPSLKFTIEIRPRVMPESNWSLLVNNAIIVEENSTVVLHPSVFPNISSKEDAISRDPRFFVVVAPTKGRLLDKRRRSKKPITQFSTADVINSRIAFRHGPAEIGVKTRIDIARIWDFKTGKIFSLNFTLTPVNSQAPRLKNILPLQVKEGSSAILNHYTMSVRDPDTAEDQIELRLVLPPRWGHLELHGNKTNFTSEGDSHSESFIFTAHDLAEGRVFYVNSRHGDGQESISDVFTIRAYDGSSNQRSSGNTLEIPVSIHPVNDEIPVVRLLEHFSVPKDGRKVLTPYLFTISDRDVPRDTLQIQFPLLPQYGYLTVFWQHGEQYTITEKSAPISETYLGMLNLVYVQNGSLLPAEKIAPTFLATDRFTVSVSDGEHKVLKSASILIRPVNEHPPDIFASPEDGIHLKGVAWKLLNEGLRVDDKDTPADELMITVIRAPQLGRLERLPKSAVDENQMEDLVEEAWDSEERLGRSDELQHAGSIGGGSGVKILQEGDRFTKRQLDMDRVFYIYTGSYTSHTVYDSVILTASDGTYEAGPVTIPVSVKGTLGRPRGPSVYSQSYLHAQLLDKEEQSQDKLLSDAVYSTPSLVKRDVFFQNDEATTSERLSTTGTDDSSGENNFHTILLSNDISVILTKLDIAQGQSMTLTSEQLRLESMKAGEDAMERDNLMKACVFEILAENEFGCLVMKRPHSGEETISNFTYRDVLDENIVISAEQCGVGNRKLFIIKLLVAIPGSDITHTIAFSLELIPDNISRPTVRIGTKITILPASDTHLSSKNIHLIPNPFIDSTKIYLFTNKTQPQRLHWRGDCANSVSLFTLFDVENEMIFYHDLNDSSPRDSIELTLVNLNHLEVKLSNDQAKRFVESIYATPSTGITQYIREEVPNILTNQPIKLQIRMDNAFLAMTNAPVEVVAPRPEDLVKVQTGKMGFFLTPHHLFSSKPDTTYTIISPVMSTRSVISIQSGKVVESFTQDDVNRLRLAYVVATHPLVEYFGRLSIAEDRLKLLVMSSDSQSNSAYMNKTIHFHWAHVGFDRKRYRICSSSGTLRLRILRRGALDHRVEVYVGLNSDAELGNTEIELLSSKIQTFEPGESENFVKIRINYVPADDDGKKTFSAHLKAPTAAILDERSETMVLIMEKRKCQASSYFTVQESSSMVLKKIPSKKRITLNEFLSGNVLPDSNTLSKVFSNSLIDQPKAICDSGWSMYQSRCYKYFPNRNQTWLEARTTCEGEHGYLISVTNQQLTNWLSQRLGVRSPLWIGLHKPLTDGAWMWHSLEQSDFTNWEKGFPHRLRPLPDSTNRHRRPQHRRLHQREISVPNKPNVGSSPIWQSSSAVTFGRQKRWAQEYTRKRENPKRKTNEKPNVCVMQTENLMWRNQPCVLTKLPYICMKNPNTL